MKKSKILVVALIGLLMAGGLALAGCSDGQSCKDQYKCKPAQWGCNKSSCGAKYNDPWIDCSC